MNDQVNSETKHSSGERVESQDTLDAQALAQEIADYLFTNGAGHKAARLILTGDDPDRRNLGGWTKKAIIYYLTNRFAAFNAPE